MRWEYKTLVVKKTWLGKIDTDMYDAELNAAGRDGWELVSVTQDAVGVIAVFKRTK